MSRLDSTSDCLQARNSEHPIGEVVAPIGVAWGKGLRFRRGFAAIVWVAVACGPIEGQQDQDAAAPDPSATVGVADAPREAAYDTSPDSLPALDLGDQERKALEALGYLIATHEAPEESGVTVYDPMRAQPGANLYTSQFGREAFLIDMEGRTLHTWSYRKHSPVEERVKFPRWWRTVHLDPNGDLLAQVDYGALIKLDKDSNLIWEYQAETHHDMQVAPDGSIFVLTTEPRVVPWIDPKWRVAEDFVVHLSADGKELKRVSLMEAIVRGGQKDLVTAIQQMYAERPATKRRDVTHTNSIQILGPSASSANPPLRSGQLLLSVPIIDTVMVLDFEAGKIVWSIRGSFRYQHDPTLLRNGHLLLFDNRGRGERSAALELDLRDGSEQWAYRGSAEDPLYSACCGRVYRLPNGNTLIVESEPGRALEVTPNKEVVWEFFNPRRFQEGIVFLNDVRRIDPSFPLDWIEGDPGEPAGTAIAGETIGAKGKLPRSH